MSRVVVKAFIYIIQPISQNLNVGMSGQPSTITPPSLPAVATTGASGTAPLWLRAVSLTVDGQGIHCEFCVSPVEQNEDYIRLGITTLILYFAPSGIV